MSSPDAPQFADALTDLDDAYARVSFSTDFALSITEQQPQQQHKQQQQGDEEYSTKFEFCMSFEPPMHGASPADEIFRNGKLLPLPLAPPSPPRRLRAKDSAVSIPADESCQSSACASPILKPSEPISPRAPTCSDTWKEIFRFGSSSSSSSSSGSGSGHNSKVVLCSDGSRSQRVSWSRQGSFKLVRLLFKRELLGKDSSEEDSEAESSSAAKDGKALNRLNIDNNHNTNNTDSNADAFLAATPSPIAALKGRRRPKSATTSSCSLSSSSSGAVILKNLERCRKNYSSSKADPSKRRQQQEQQQQQEAQTMQTQKQADSQAMQTQVQVQQQQQQQHQESALPCSEKAGSSSPTALSFSSSVRVAPVLNVPTMRMDPVKETKRSIRKLMLSNARNAQRVSSWASSCSSGGAAV